MSVEYWKVRQHYALMIHVSMKKGTNLVVKTVTRDSRASPLKGYQLGFREGGQK